MLIYELPYWFQLMERLLSNSYCSLKDPERSSAVTGEPTLLSLSDACEFICVAKCSKALPMWNRVKSICEQVRHSLFSSKKVQLSAQFSEHQVPCMGMGSLCASQQQVL
jgi:hypothetical protein